MSSHHVEQAARIIYQCRHPNGDPIGGTFNGPSWVELEMRDARAVAEMLDRAGLLAPAPPREGGEGWYEVIHPSRATTHIAYVHEDGSIYFPEGTQVLGRHEFDFAAARGLVHRLVRAEWRTDA